MKKLVKKVRHRESSIKKNKTAVEKHLRDIKENTTLPKIVSGAAILTAITLGLKFLFKRKSSSAEPINTAIATPAESKPHHKIQRLIDAIAFFSSFSTLAKSFFSSHKKTDLDSDKKKHSKED